MADPVYWYDGAGNVTQVAHFLKLEVSGVQVPTVVQALFATQVSLCLQRDHLGRITSVALATKDQLAVLPVDLCYLVAESPWDIDGDAMVGAPPDLQPDDPLILPLLTMAYDARNRRSEKQVLGMRWRYAHGPADELIEERVEPVVGVGLPGSVALTRSWIRAGGELIARRDHAHRNVLDPASGQRTTRTLLSRVLWYHGDHLGTPQALTDERGSVVWKSHWRDPFGGPVQDQDPDGDGAQVSEPVRLPGQYDDGYFAWIGEAGPYHNWTRTFSPRIGRYLEPDPQRQTLPSTPDQVFSYANGAPLTGLDPFGMYVLHGTCGAWNTAVALIRNRVGTTECNSCRNRFPFGCNIDAWLVPGNDPDVFFPDWGVFGFRAYTNCAGFRSGPPDSRPNAVNIAQRFCGEPVVLAGLIVHEFTRWCSCQGNEYGEGQQAGTNTEVACGF
ncbi:MAG: RHS domain-containing protein [Deltaproteobacteria bacterium]|nr:RHS domain-containing protein [Deltaproteobacteria bacterium]